MEYKGARGQGKKAESPGLTGTIKTGRTLDTVIEISEIETINMSGTAERQGYTCCVYST